MLSRLLTPTALFLLLLSFLAYGAAAAADGDDVLRPLPKLHGGKLIPYSPQALEARSTINGLLRFSRRQRRECVDPGFKLCPVDGCCPPDSRCCPGS
jgi:hypothetical protein